MTTIRRFAPVLTLVFCGLLSAARAQTPQLNSVNLTAEPGRVRAATQGDVFDLKLEVVDEAGETVFEATDGGGETLDWNMRDARGQRVAPGTYTVVVSYTTQSGKPRKRIEQVLVTEEVKGAGSVQSTTVQKPSAATVNAPNPTPQVDGSGSANRIPKFTDADTLTISSMSDVSGRIGIGTTAPAVPGLHIGSGVSGGQARLRLDNSNGTNGGLNRWTNRLELTSSDAIGLSVGGVSKPHMWINASGNVGIGTFAPSVNGLHIGASVSGGQAQLRLDNSNGRIGELNRWTNRLELMSSDAIGLSVGGTSNPNLWIGANGRVGIGTFSPFTRFHVESFGVSELTVRSPDERAILSLDASPGGQRRVWTLESAPFGEAGKFGIFDRTAGRARLTIDTAGRTYLDGNAAQQLNAGGWAKFMLRVDPAQPAGSQITYCYNSQLPDGGASQPGCGFTANGTSVGHWIVGIGHNIGKRFAVISINDRTVSNHNTVVAVVYPTSTVTGYQVSLRYSTNGDLTNAPFTLIVY